MESSGTVRQDLISNIRLGIGCAFYRPTNISRLIVNTDQLILLLLIDAVLTLMSGYLLALPDPEFYPFSLPVYALILVMTLLAAALATRLIRLPTQVLRLSILIFATAPAMHIGGYLLQALQNYVSTQLTTTGAIAIGGVGILLTAWVLAVAFRMLALLQGRYSWRSAASSLSLIIISALPAIYYADSVAMWYPADPEGTENDAWAAYRSLDTESLLYQQRPQLTQALATLEPETPGQTDVYFLGFAGYARENVFSNEVRLARQIFDARFGTSQRSLALINHLDTHNDIPLATSNNLRIALQHLGQIMNPEEDILVLFMTSHGSRQHALSVDFWPMRLNDITPQMLKRYLDDAGIRWRAVMVSSCYSGGFVPPLQDANSLIATAASADRTSFGCGRNRELTYFGEAFLRDQLNHSYSITESLHTAIKTIGNREVREKLTPSQPQLFIGDAMRHKLMQLEQSLSVRECMPTLTAC